MDDHDVVMVNHGQAKIGEMVKAIELRCNSFLNDS